MANQQPTFVDEGPDFRLPESSYNTIRSRIDYGFSGINPKRNGTFIKGQNSDIAPTLGAILDPVHPGIHDLRPLPNYMDTNSLNDPQHMLAPS